MVSALTATPGVYFDSPPDSGYSMDNIAPSVPTGLVMIDDLLVWGGPMDVDFDYFTVYGSNSPELEPGATVVGYTVGTEYTVDPSSYAYWHVTATDHAGNESEAATTSDVTEVTDSAPLRTALYPNVPNPFNPSTEVHFTLAAAGHVRLTVHDLAGRLVRTLVDGQLAAGRQHVGWNGCDDEGQQVASGVYVCRLEAAGHREMTRMVLVK
jgi:hypothetical protein